MNVSEEEMNRIMSGNPALARKNPDLAKELGIKLPKAPEPPKKKRQPKYHNKKVYVYGDGFVSVGEKAEGHGDIARKYDSQKEYRRYLELELLEKAGEISGLQRQVEFVIQPAFSYRGKKYTKIAYVADHVYTEDGETVVEDVKGISRNGKTITTTKDFKLKWKLLMAKFPEYRFEIV